MWAAIRDINGNPPKQCIIPLENIMNFDETKSKSRIFNYYTDKSQNQTARCRVICYAATKAEVEYELKSKRQNLIPDRLLESASEPESQPSKKTKKNNINPETKEASMEETVTNRLEELRRKRARTNNMSTPDFGAFERGSNEESLSCSKCDEANNHITELRKEIDLKNNEIRELEATVEGLRDENARLKVQLTKLEHADEKLRNDEQRVQEVKALNVKWQTDGLNILSEIKDILGHRYQDNVETLRCKTLYPSGYINENEMIHLGRDVWLSLPTYAYVTANAKSVSALTRNLTVAVFGFDALRQSTISGKKSNRARKSTDENADPVTQLDPVRVMAIKDCVRYILIDEWKMDETRADQEVDSVRQYIAKKIADLKADRPIGTKRSKTSAKDIPKKRATENKDDHPKENGQSSSHDEDSTGTRIDPFVNTVFLDQTAESTIVGGNIISETGDDQENIDYEID